MVAGQWWYLAARCLRWWFWGLAWLAAGDDSVQRRCRKERSGSLLGHSSLMDARLRSPRAHEPCRCASCASCSDSQPATLSLRSDGRLHAHPNPCPLKAPPRQKTLCPRSPLTASSSSTSLPYLPRHAQTLLLFFQGRVACCPQCHRCRRWLQCICPLFVYHHINTPTPKP
jgi:hypothetical protein